MKQKKSKKKNKELPKKESPKPVPRKTAYKQERGKVLPENSVKNLKELTLVIDLLRGRITIYDKRIGVQILLYLIMVGFWTFVVWNIGGWSLTIPALSNLNFSSFFGQGRSP